MGIYRLCRTISFAQVGPVNGRWNIIVYDLTKNPYLCQILSRSEAFNEAFRLLDLAITEAIQPDLLLYNAILKIASQKVIYLSQFVVL